MTEKAAVKMEGVAADENKNVEEGEKKADVVEAKKTDEVEKKQVLAEETTAEGGRAGEGTKAQSAIADAVAPAEKEPASNGPAPELASEAVALAIKPVVMPAKQFDVGRCLVIEGLPTQFQDDPVDVFNDAILQMMSEDFSVARDNIDAVVRLSLHSDPQNEENACRALVSFKSRVHKHRVFAMKGRVDTSMELVHLDAIPDEAYEQSAAETASSVSRTESQADTTSGGGHANGDGEDHGEGKTEDEKKVATEGEDEVMEGDEDDVVEVPQEEEKKNEEKNELDKQLEEKEKQIQGYKDEHEDLPFEINWEGAPEFQWRIVDGPMDSRRLVVENVDMFDLYEPFFYRTLVRAESFEIKMPGRTMLDRPNVRLFGTLTLTFYAEFMAMQEAMRNLVYSRCSTARRLKIFLPQSKMALGKKEDFEALLGRKIAPTPAMHTLLLKAEDLSLDESTLTLEDAQETFPNQKVVGVDRIVDPNKKTGFVVTFATARDAVFAHASRRRVNVGAIACRVLLIGVESGYPDRADAYVTRSEKQALRAEIRELKRKQTAERNSSSAGPPAKRSRNGLPARDNKVQIHPANPKKNVMPDAAARGSARAASWKGRGAQNTGINRGGQSSGFNNNNGMNRGGQNSGMNRGGGIRSARGQFPNRTDTNNKPMHQPFRPGFGPRGSPMRGGMPNRGTPAFRSGGNTMNSTPGRHYSPSGNQRGHHGGGGGSGGREMDEMIREQRKRLELQELQEQLLRQEQIIGSLTGRLQDAPPYGRGDRLSSYSSGSGGGSGLTSQSAFSKGSAAMSGSSPYTPSPAYEPLPNYAAASSGMDSSSSRTPYDFPSPYGYEKSSSAGYGGSGSGSSYRDRRY